MRVRSFLSVLGLFTAAALSGCSGDSGTAPMTPGAAMQSQATQAQTQAQTQTKTIGFSESGFSDDASTDGAASIGVRLNSEKAVVNKKYGRLLGYANGTTTKTTHVVMLARGAHVIFHNVDTVLPHTGSLLGDATKKSAPWPATFTGSSQQAKAGTDISTAGFSTGPMSPGTSSLTYVANVPGFYMFGCAFHYVSSGMRDIIIVQ